MVRSPSQTTIEDALGKEEEATPPFIYSITSYGADFSVDLLVKRIERGDIFVPSFQREYVWSIQRASKFIESLLLGLPVPGIFLSKERESQKLLVIDGQQRLRTLQYFYRGIFPSTKREFALVGVQKKFRELTYATLRDEDRRRLDDSIIHATIIQQDDPSDDNSGITYIFERINTGGLQLQGQEIRSAVYHGKLSETISKLNEIDEWRSIFGPRNNHMRDQELILRFFALYYGSDRYSEPMRTFLDNYMSNNRDLSEQSSDELESLFRSTISSILECLGTRSFRFRQKRALNAAVFDSVMVGVARRLSFGNISNCSLLRQRYDALLGNESYVSSTTRTTADAERVRNRLQLATETFQDVE